MIEAVRRALVEDIGSGDLTTNLCVPDNAKGSGIFLAREPMIVTGVDLLPILYDGEDIEVLFSDGTPIEADVVFARVSGSIRRLLELERTTLNFLQRLCGIAVTTRKFVKAVEGTGCVILDTRKTTPGLRRLEKLATRVGGAWNHRFGLFDAVLIKNNHIAAAGGVQQAVEKAKKQNELPIEIEVRNLTELDEALDAGASHLMLDNFTPELVHQAMRKVTCDVKIEVSGGITAENVREYADAGPDFISIGAITHSAPATDISFRLT
ncbi:MAG: nicotinate-nucleotide diphosphorylase (carboxylating) [Solibacterales bacterium]|nr:nicotinate-nucleotide diphosphorylase (carboxylating) [Bryobacterales bacterium]